jgi:hypothetical protein
MKEKSEQKIVVKKKRSLRPKYNKEDLGINPLIQDLVVERRKIKIKNNYVELDSCVREEGEIVDIKRTSIQETTFYVEQDAYTKVYTKSALRLYIMQLSNAAKELYLWLVYELDKNEDHVWINIERFMEECSISSMTTYRTTVKELQKNVIIYPTIIKDIYWINPLFFFNGNRIDKYETKVKTI